MDPLSITAAVAGLFKATLKIGKLLGPYISAA